MSCKRLAPFYLSLIPLNILLIFASRFARAGKRVDDKVKKEKENKQFLSFSKNKKKSLFIKITKLLLLRKDISHVTT